MKTSVLSERKCSAILAAGAGAAICLSGGNAVAVSGTDGNDIPIHATRTEFAGKIAFYNSSGPMLIFRGANSTRVACTATFVNAVPYSGGANCTVAVAWTSFPFFAGDWSSNKYIKIRFKEGATTKYGWSELRISGSTFVFGAWSYNNTGGAIKTLADSVTATKLSLSDGRTKLHWSNKNEDGVARYEVQAKDSNGEWKAVDSSAPGTGSYATNVSKDSTCRLVVEMVDGQTHEVNF